MSPSKCRLIADLAAAFSAGSSAALLFSANSFSNRGQANFFLYIRFTVLALATYLIVALIFHKFWIGFLRASLKSIFELGKSRQLG